MNPRVSHGQDPRDGVATNKVFVREVAGRKGGVPTSTRALLPITPKYSKLTLGSKYVTSHVALSRGARTQGEKVPYRNGHNVVSQLKHHPGKDRRLLLLLVI